MIKNPSAMRETQETEVPSLGWEDPLVEGMSIHSSILAWRIPWRKEPGRQQFMRSQRVRPNEGLNTRDTKDGGGKPSQQSGKGQYQC